MATLMGEEELRHVAPLGVHIALRIGFAFPLEEINTLPAPWVEQYSRQRLMMYDPVMRWAYTNTGAIRWSALEGQDDQRKVLQQAKTFGLKFGVTVSVADEAGDGQRSFGSFLRSDREFSDLEVNLLRAYMTRRHTETAPPTNLTRAELEALRMIKDGKRLKEIAFELGVTEGAVKQRLKNAKLKLDAKTSTQAAALANQYGLL